MLSAKHRREILSGIYEEYASGDALVETVAAAWASGRWLLPAGNLVKLATRVGLLEGDTAAMWRGIRQAHRLAELETTLLGGHAVVSADSYTHVLGTFRMLAAGERGVFDRWLAKVPRRLEFGHPWTKALSNAVTAWGHGDPELIKRSQSELTYARQLSAVGKYGQATLDVLRGAFGDNADLVASGLARAVPLWTKSREAWDDWFLAEPIIALFNIARTCVSAPITLPEHPRFSEPPRMNAPLEDGLVDFSSRLPELEQWWRELPATFDPKTCRVLDARPSPPAGSAEPLLRAIYGNPGDDGPRHVFADWLMDRGDERGEFISLQLRAAAGGKLSKEEKARVRLLLELNGRSWLDSLQGRSGLRQIEFERGFLSSCHMRKWLDDPALSTLRELHGSVPSDAASLPDLRVLGGLWRPDELAARTRPLSIQHLAFAGYGIAEPTPLASMTTLPNLRELWIIGAQDWVSDDMTPDHLMWLWRAPVAQTLRSLTCPLPCLKLPQFVEAWLCEGRLEELTVSTQAGHQWDYGWQLRLRRTPAGLEFHLASSPKPKPKSKVRGRRPAPEPSLFESLIAGLSALPADRVTSSYADRSVAKNPEGKQLLDALPSFEKNRRLRRRDKWW